MKSKIRQLLFDFFVMNYTQGNIAQRVDIWLDVIEEDIRLKKYTADQVVTGINSLMRKQIQFPVVAMLINEISKQNRLDVL